MCLFSNFLVGGGEGRGGRSHVARLNFKTSRVGVYKRFMSGSESERNFFVFVGILEKGIEMCCKETITIVQFLCYYVVYRTPVHRHSQLNGLGSTF